MSSSSKKEKISVELFSAGLAEAFKGMKTRNIENLGKGIKSVRKIKRDKSVKLNKIWCPFSVHNTSKLA